MATLIERTVGEHRGTLRVYLDGMRLAREGILPGMSYQRIINREEGKIIIRMVESGDYVVSKKIVRENEIPVLDIKTDDLAGIVGRSGKVRIFVANMCIVILRHFNDEKVAERIKRMLAEIENKQLTTASLFHGGGIASKGIHSGLETAGLGSKTALAIEIETEFVESSLKNNPELWDKSSVIINAGVESVRYHQAGIPKVTIFEAGIPCTGSSQAGSSKLKLKCAEEHPTAGAAFFYTLQAIDATNPCIIVFENVKNYAGSASASVIRSVLSNLGYSMQEVILRGNDFGALENRERWIMIATTVGLEEFININDLFNYKQTPPSNVSQILEDEVDDSVWSDLRYLKDKEQRDFSAGKGFRMQILNGDSLSCPTLTKGYHKRRSTDPYIKKDDDSELLRLFTAKEHARLKTIPESALEGLSESVAHQIAGQSVIYNWFVAIGRIIGDGLQLFSNKNTKDDLLEMPKSA